MTVRSIGQEGLPGKVNIHAGADRYLPEEIRGSSRCAANQLTGK
jgi:hypothetical protein